MREAFGGTVNDAILAVVSGTLRGWLLARGEPLRPASSVRALIPVSVADDADGDGNPRPGVAHVVQPLVVDLPVGEPQAVLRIAQLRYAMASHKASGRAVRAETLTALGGYAPPTLHALGARAASGLTRRMFDLVVTNVPGPQVPLFAAGTRMTEMFPFLPLAEGQVVSIALSSYDGGVYYGINGDREALRDVALLADLIEESLGELVDAADAAIAARQATAATSSRRPARATAPTPPPEGSS